MKKAAAAVIFIAAVCISFFAGQYLSGKKQTEARAEKCQTMMTFAADKLDEMSGGYDEDTMEALISNVYAAYEYCDDPHMASALHDLWNALIFDGENISGKEEELKSALQSGNAEEIEGFAAELRA